jgi:hypothetical protein
LAYAALKLTPYDGYAKRIIAGKIIDIAKSGEMSADALCERTLAELYGPSVD